MTPLDTLAPDQRAVLELVLRQGRSYGELSELLGIPERDVRARADAGLRALAGEAEASVDTGRIADWLLGQQPEAEAERTRAAVARSAAARTWAAAAAERLREMGGASVPDVPAGEDDAAERADAAERGDAPAKPADAAEPGDAPAKPADAAEPGDAPAKPADAPAARARPRPRPLREDAPPAAQARARRDGPRGEDAGGGTRSAPRSSRLGGAILIAVLVVIVGGLIAFVVTRGGDDEPSASSQEQPQATATATPAATANANDIVLQGTNGSKAAGLMRLIPSNDGTVQFAIAAQNVPPNQGREVYAVWFTRSGAKPIRLGFAQSQVGNNGVLTTGGPQKRDLKTFPRWFATYSKVLITRETNAKATKPGPAVLQGTLPGGA
jgi:hypothetical protein